ncbi:AraC family transcriptional regulator [Paenibacillus arenilitoris]|uniref:AraC family transcriptional regulator n=1 Tax=Paenibacillus arenilitoris TaxID=2772299 RepID=A0A927CFW9_9BACL|nr:AraC family transcriptional regulator [Paenibacillus arenilitoris]MBD2867343.1 AraC family transcriptional regulator [Paenibacillus arenilitoris]
MEQGVAVSMVFPIVKTLVHKGCDPESFFRHVSFNAGLLQDTEARIDGAELERLMLAAADYTGDDYFGLRQGRLTEIEDLGILGYVMTHAGTIAGALAAYRRYNVILCSGFNLEWEEDGDDVMLRLYLHSPDGRMSRHCMDDMASSLHHLIGRLSARRVPLRELAFSHAAPGDAGPYSDVFGCEPRFGVDSNYLRMDKDVLQYPIMYSDARLLGIFEAIAAETSEKLIGGRALSDRVYQWMLRCIPSYFPTLAQTADSFGMSARSLQVKLKEENRSYNELAAAVRKELAMSYLSKREHSVSDIAYLLHYSEPSAFQSAFKKWTGLTPAQYRTTKRAGLSG